MSEIAKILILGAESTGKSALAEALARHYHSPWVPEYLREFVETGGRVPQEPDQLPIAETQLARERLALEQARSQGAAWLFCDTSPLLTSIYGEHYFKQVDPRLLDLAEQHDYDFTFVTAPDFPWQPDGILRESPAVRAHIHEKILAALEQAEIPHMLVTGSLSERVEQVSMALDFLRS